MANRYLSLNAEGEIVFTQILIEETPDNIESIIGTGITYKAITTEKLAEVDGQFHSAIETDFTKPNDNTITVSLAKAKLMTKDRLRAQRKTLLEAQDLLFLIAQETSADTTAIVTEKNRLRDITDDTDSCTTLDELKALTITE